MALTDQQKLDLMYRILREELNNARLSQLTTDAPRRVGQFVKEFGISEEEARDFIRPLIASFIYELAKTWELLSKLDNAFCVEQDLKEKFKNK
jgi:ubiquinone/menaquinone biosynthesis C-methylase UbiE